MIMMIIERDTWIKVCARKKPKNEFEQEIEIRGGAYNA